jgi:hypothetical protein
MPLCLEGVPEGLVRGIGDQQVGGTQKVGHATVEHLKFGFHIAWQHPFAAREGNEFLVKIARRLAWRDRSRGLPPRASPG